MTALEMFLKFGVHFPLDQHPSLLWADSVPGDAQWMGSYDRALHPVCGAKDGYPYSRGVLMVLHPERQLGQSGIFFYFGKRVAKGVQTVTKIKESLGNWKDAFFFTLEVGVRGPFGSPSKFLQ